MTGRGVEADRRGRPRRRRRPVAPARALADAARRRLARPRSRPGAPRGAVVLYVRARGPRCSARSPSRTRSARSRREAVGACTELGVRGRDDHRRRPPGGRGRRRRASASTRCSPRCCPRTRTAAVARLQAARRRRRDGRRRGERRPGAGPRRRGHRDRRRHRRRDRVGRRRAGRATTRGPSTDVIRLSRATYRKMVQNLAWATGYNVARDPAGGGCVRLRRPHARAGGRRRAHERVDDRRGRQRPAAAAAAPRPRTGGSRCAPGREPVASAT